MKKITVILSVILTCAAFNAFGAGFHGQTHSTAGNGTHLRGESVKSATVVGTTPGTGATTQSAVGSQTYQLNNVNVNTLNGTLK